METKVSDRDVLLNAREVAAMLSISRALVLVMSKDGRLKPALRLSDKVLRFRKSDVLALFADNKPASPNI